MNLLRILTHAKCGILMARWPHYIKRRSSPSQTRLRPTSPPTCDVGGQNWKVLQDHQSQRAAIIIISWKCIFYIKIKSRIEICCFTSALSWVDNRWRPELKSPTGPPDPGRQRAWPEQPPGCSPPASGGRRAPAACPGSGEGSAGLPCCPAHYWQAK